MKKECSFGIIPLKKEQGQWKVFLVQHKQGHWGFPKGHIEEGETPKETAQRELFEETKLKVKHYFSDKPICESYRYFFHSEERDKTVCYFLAEVEGSPAICKNELIDYGWFSFETALEKITFEQAKRVLKKAERLLISLLKDSF